MPSWPDFRGPLADSYWAAVMLVVCALVPYLALTSALTPLQPVLEKSLPLGPQALQVTTGMANAAYAFGTVLAVQFAVHLRGRRMLLVYVCLFIVGSVLAALAPTPGLFIAGHVVQGLTTSLMLIAAVPPLVVGWPARRMPITGGVMNLCIFGAVAVGPAVGGIQAGTGHWRALFWIVAGIGALALVFALLTYEDQPPQDLSAPWDWVAIVLAGGGTAAAFFGASELQTHPMLDVIVIVPLIAGLVMIIALVAYQYRIRRPLMPVRQLATTFPVAGITVVMCTGAASVALITLAETALQTRFSPTYTAMLFWPQFGAALAAAVLFGALFRTRLIPALVLAGTLALVGGAAVLSGVAHGPAVLVLVGSGLAGLGVGWCVSPALFMTGFSLPSAQIQRVFALVELLRGVAAFIAGPLLVHLATTVGSGPAAGTRIAIWVCLGITAGGGILAVVLYALGGQPPRPPDLERWQDGESPAWRSPPLAAAVSSGRQRGPSAERSRNASRPPSRETT
ncbi:MAG TPA: MFS transporter [Solirubrobacteraceae bacterium]|nr:MFS transporter [Solirubrobacteraceae bacterium]